MSKIVPEFWFLLAALSHLVCSLIKMWPPAEAGQRWPRLQELNKRGEIAPITVYCKKLNDAHVPPPNPPPSWECNHHDRCRESWGNLMCQKQELRLLGVKSKSKKKKKNGLPFYRVPCAALGFGMSNFVEFTSANWHHLEVIQHNPPLNCFVFCYFDEQTKC